MKNIKKLVALATLLAMAATSSSNLSAQEYYTDYDGQGYNDSSMSGYLPYIAVGAVAVIAIVAVACRSHGGGGGSSHGSH